MKNSQKTYSLFNYEDRIPPGPISWELDALRPEVLNQILTDEIERRIDPSKFSAMMEIERNDKTKLRTLKSKL